MTDTTKKLSTCEASLKRWHTRLTRAANMVAKLEKQRRRLMPVRTMADRTAEQKAEGRMPGLGTVTTAPVTDIPDFLNRANPLIAEQMTAARKKAEAAARSAMPLTGRAAQDFIKSKRKKA